jgi:acyl carrier protein
MIPRTSDEILLDLAKLLSNFNGREYSGAIRRETLFFGDLGMVSIDAIIFGETLEERYGRKLPFHQFLASVGRQDVHDIAVGELVEFLNEQLNAGGGRS